MKIFIKKDKIVKVEHCQSRNAQVLRDGETHAEILEEKKVSKAIKNEPDAVTGATYSSDAIMKNVQIGLEYYNAHK